MPKKTPLLLPSFAWLNTKAAPKIELVGFSRAAGLEDNLALMTLRAFLPELFGWDRLG